MIEEKLKRIVGKVYERWIARIRDVGIQDDALNLSCLDGFHDFFPLLSIRRTDEWLGKDKDFDAWYPIRDDVEEKILAVGLCSFDAGFDVPQDDALNFNISCIAVDEIVMKRFNKVSCDIKISKNATSSLSSRKISLERELRKLTEEKYVITDGNFIKRHLGHWLVTEIRNDAIKEFAKTKKGKELLNAMENFLDFCNDKNFYAQKR